MNDTIYISVVIPLYNKQKSIAATLQSVLAQSYTNYEIIVVDDGSTDGSAEVAEAILQECMVYSVECRVKVIRKANGGVSSARNIGIMEAKGEYIAFLDGDDLWGRDYLKVSAKLIADFPNAGIYGSASGLVINDVLTDETTLYVGHRGWIENPWVVGPPFSTSATIVDKKVFDIVGTFDERMTHGEDLDMWWRIVLKYPCVYEDVVHSYYRIAVENSLMSKPIPLETHLPNFIDKYTVERANNEDFRKFFDKEMIYRLYPYLFDKKNRKTAKELASQLDYSLQKITMRLRIHYPLLYRMYQKLIKIPNILYR